MFDKLKSKMIGWFGADSAVRSALSNIKERKVRLAVAILLGLAVAWGKVQYPQAAPVLDAIGNSIEDVIDELEDEEKTQEDVNAGHVIEAPK